MSQHLYEYCYAVNTDCSCFINVLIPKMLLQVESFCTIIVPRGCERERNGNNNSAPFLTIVVKVSSDNVPTCRPWQEGDVQTVLLGCTATTPSAQLDLCDYRAWQEVQTAIGRTDERKERLQSCSILSRNRWRAHRCAVSFWNLIPACTDADLVDGISPDWSGCDYKTALAVSAIQKGE